jgi:hypothetical protein
MSQDWETMAMILGRALQALYDEVESSRQRRQDYGLHVIQNAAKEGLASSFHPSQWTTTPAQIMAEDALAQLAKMGAK